MFASENGIKAIFFDLDGTLRHTVPSVADTHREKMAEWGVQISAEENQEVGRWEHYYWARSAELMNDSEKFDGDDEAFWRNYMTKRLKKMNVESAEIERLLPLLNSFFEKEYAPKNWVPPEVYELLPQLRKAGYTLAVLSNRRSSFMDIMDELSLTKHFDAIMFAGEVGSWKPDPAVFTPLLERFELAPEETLYIGDNYYADVVGSRKAGLVPVLYDPRGIFPDADCARITSFNALSEIL